MYMLLLLLLPSLLLMSNATTYYVGTNNDYNYQLNIDVHTLMYYIDNANKYFVSHTRLYFLPGQHHFSTDFIINSTTNFSVSGDHSTIVCMPSASINVVNVTDFQLININLLNCGKGNYYTTTTQASLIELAQIITYLLNF